MNGNATATAVYTRYDSRLTLVTYNILGLPSWMTGADSRRYPRIRFELEQLDPDIILLQEAWTAKARKAAPANGAWSIARAQRQHTFFQQSGLVTLSKFPILGGQFYPFTREAFPDRIVNKGALKVTVRLQDGRVLNVWNVHLQQGGSEKIRHLQARELVSRVRAAEDGQIADLVGGDFNCMPGSALCRELEASLGPSVHQLSGGEPFATWKRLSGETARSKMVDYIFVRARVPLKDTEAIQRVVFAAASPGQQLSDHLGIHAVLNLAPATSLAEVTGLSLPGLSVPEAGAARVKLGGGE